MDPPGIAVTDIRFRGERIVYELALMDSQAIYGGALRDQFMCLAEKCLRCPGEKWCFPLCICMYDYAGNVCIVCRCIVIYIYNIYIYEYDTYIYIYTDLGTIVSKWLHA